MEQFNEKSFQVVWNALRDVPVNDDLEIEIPFLDYPAGTECTEIWHDLEHQYNISIGEKQFKHDTHE